MKNKCSCSEQHREYTDNKTWFVCRNCKKQYYWEEKWRTWVFAFESIKPIVADTVKRPAAATMERRDKIAEFKREVNNHIPRDRYGRPLTPSAMVNDEKRKPKDLYMRGIDKLARKKKKDYKLQVPEKMWHDQVSSGVESIDQKKDYIKAIAAKEVDLKFKVILRCQDMKFRMMCYEHIGDKIRLLWTELTVIEDVPFGTQVGVIEWDGSRYEIIARRLPNHSKWETVSGGVVKTKNVLKIQPRVEMGMPCPKDKIVTKEII
jgi:hypothetical protein